MQLVKWSYARHYNIKAVFDRFPNSPVVFRKIRDYYFIYTVHWTRADPPVQREDLEQMERLLNRELGTELYYLSRHRSDYSS